MNNTIIPITLDDFNKNVVIKFNNILDGLDAFQNFMLEPKNISLGEEEIINYILKVFEINNSSCYIDFYINKLSSEERDNLMNLVPIEDKNLLKSIFEINPLSNYFKVENKDLIPFLARLSTRENFFITFYFTQTPITIWSNYGLKFPCFCLNKKDLDFYINQLN